MERGYGAILPLSRFSNLVRFRFLYRLKHIFAPFKPVLDPVPMPFLPLFKPFFPLSKPVPSIFCATHLSYLDTCHLQPNHWTTLDNHRSADQWEVCIRGKEMLGTSLHNMLLPRMGANEATPSRRQGRKMCHMSRRREDSTC